MKYKLMFLSFIKSVSACHGLIKVNIAAAKHIFYTLAYNSNLT